MVVVPARDEEALVGRCLAALQAARQAARAVLPDLTVDLVLVLDRCTDGTRSVALGHLDVRLVDLDEGRVGAARAAGVRDALDRATTDPDRTWLASTDADSAVPEGWILEHVRLADAGADVVVGTVRPDPADLTPTQLAGVARDPRPGPTQRARARREPRRARRRLPARGRLPRPARARGRRPGGRARRVGRARRRDGRLRRRSPRGAWSAGHPAGYADYLRSRFGADDEAESA